MRAAAVSWGMALGLTMSAAALAGPPVQRPGAPTQRPAPPTDQPALDEVPPAQAEVPPPPEVDVPPPVDIEPPVEAEPAPEPDAAALPRYDASPPSDGAANSAELPPNDWSDFDMSPPVRAFIPPPGTGRMAVGGIMLVGGTLLASVSGSMILFTEDWALGIAGAVVSAGSIVSGVLLLTTGSVRRKNYRAWAEGYGGARAIPAPGAGLLAAGTTCVVAGPLGVLIGGISLTLQDEDDLPYGQVLIPLGAVSIAGGVTMLVIGAKRKQKFERWHAQHGLTPSFSLLPAGPTRVAGASFGLAGRF